MAEQTENLNHREHAEDPHQGDAVADAVAAIALIAIFVVACIYWVSGQ